MRNTWSSSLNRIYLNNRNVPVTVTGCETCPSGFGRSTFNLMVPADHLIGQNDNYTQNHPGGESDMNFHTLSLALNKRFRNNFFYNVYFDYQWRSEPRSPGTSSTSWAALNPLSSDPTAQGWFINYDQDIPTVQDTSTYQFKTRHATCCRTMWASLAPSGTSAASTSRRPTGSASTAAI